MLPASIACQSSPGAASATAAATSRCASESTADDADAEYERLTALPGMRVALEIRSEDFGQRHFIVVAPGEVLVDVIQPIPFTGEYAADGAA